MGREVLRRGSVGIRLAFFARFGMLLFTEADGTASYVPRMVALKRRGHHRESVRLIHDMGFAVVKLLGCASSGVRCAGQRFTGKHFHGGAVRGGREAVEDGACSCGCP